MGAFYYFLPGEHAKDGSEEGGVIERRTSLMRDAFLRKYDLQDVLRDYRHVPTHLVVTDTVVDGQKGVGIYVKPTGEMLPPKGESIDNPNIIWKKFIEPVEIYVGYNPERIPRPEDLQRSRIYQNYKISDDLDQDWYIPIIRSPGDDGIGALPMNISFDERGNVVQTVKQSFQKYWDLSGDIYEMLVEKKDHGDEWVYRSAATILEINYRVGWRELSVLMDAGTGVLDSDRTVLMLMLVVQYQLLKEHEDVKEKKTSSPALSTSSSDPGQQENGQADTVPAGSHSS